MVYTIVGRKIQVVWVRDAGKWVGSMKMLLPDDSGGESPPNKIVFINRSVGWAPGDLLKEYVHTVMVDTKPGNSDKRQRGAYIVGPGDPAEKTVLEQQIEARDLAEAEREKNRRARPALDKRDKENPPVRMARKFADDSPDMEADFSGYPDLVESGEVEYVPGIKYRWFVFLDRSACFIRHNPLDQGVEVFAFGSKDEMLSNAETAADEDVVLAGRKFFVWREENQGGIDTWENIRPATPEEVHQCIIKQHGGDEDGVGQLELGDEDGEVELIVWPMGEDARPDKRFSVH